jgi:mono/diheme cytochrome c family protein
MTSSLLRLFVSFAAVAAAAVPSLAADPDEGRRLAERWCSSCHVVSSSQTKGQDGVPSFAKIGAARELDERALTAFLSSPHPRMPDMALTRPELAALVAWIKAEGRR